ncbi:MAG TPA: penicillin acylase family protein, partial [Dehalococcoidia bacterium]|nr:penicillin acylase family protein [Dehalococcoidia bacterium]
MSELLSNLMMIPGLAWFYLRFLYRFCKAYVVGRFGLANPRKNYSTRHHGIRDEIEIIRDEYGVAHVLANNEQDAFWGSGFVQSQDRLWQMESARRFANGRLSEIAGDSAFSTDRLMRQIGLHRVARADHDLLEDEELELFKAYVSGVAAGVESLRTLPPEFHLLGLTFEPWTTTDILLTARLLLFSFTGNWKTELIREELLKNVDSKLWPFLE